MMIFGWTIPQASSESQTQKHQQVWSESAHEGVCDLVLHLLMMMMMLLPDTWTVGSPCGRLSPCIRIHVHQCRELGNSLWNTQKIKHGTCVREITNISCFQGFYLRFSAQHPHSAKDQKHRELKVNEERALKVNEGHWKKNHIAK